MSDVVLVVAAHPDDEVLGCGGTLARWVAQGRQVRVLFLTDGVGARAGTVDAATADAAARRRAAAEEAAGILGLTATEFLDFPDNRMDSVEMLTVVQEVERRIKLFSPSVVLSHHVGDVNIDHQVAHHATVTACRPQPGSSVRELLFFETASSSEWRPKGSAEPFVPNMFVDISETLPGKLDALRAYGEEIRPYPHARSFAGIESLARWRGATIGVQAAEAFIVGRSIA